jgi:hypothetical protein
MARKKTATTRSKRGTRTTRRRVETLPARRDDAAVKAGADDRPTEEVAFYYNRIAFAYGQPR